MALLDASHVNSHDDVPKSSLQDQYIDELIESGRINNSQLSQPPAEFTFTDFVTRGPKVLDDLDANKDKYLDDSEMQAGFSDPLIAGFDSDALHVMYGARTALKHASNDEWGYESAISNQDLFLVGRDNSALQQQVSIQNMANRWKCVISERGVLSGYPILLAVPTRSSSVPVLRVSESLREH